jgi:hypothetical protein
VISALQGRGFGYGSGLINPTHDRFIINVPKNASSFVLDWGRRHGWSAALAENHSDTITEMIVILRDPVERWISGMAQYINSYILSVHGPNGPIFPGEPLTEHDYTMDAQMFIDQYTDVTERLIFDVISRFDDHVWPQNEIIRDILPKVQRKYFILDHDFDQKIQQYLGWQPVSGLDRNQGSDSDNNARLQNFFRERLKQRPELYKRLCLHYADDYILLSTCQI